MKKTSLLCTLAALCGALAVWLATSHSDGDEWRRAEAVAVGHGYSVALKVKPAHPFLAEYEQKVDLFGGSAREGDLVATLNLPMNTGGRVRILLFRGRSNEAPCVLLRDRYATSLIDLRTRRLSDVRDLKEEDYQFLGAFSGEASPLKFVPASVWDRMSKAERGETANQTSEPTAPSGRGSP